MSSREVVLKTNFHKTNVKLLIRAINENGRVSKEGVGRRVTGSERR